MAYSKAYKGLKLPVFKSQTCGHAFNAEGCNVCPTCRTRVKARATASDEALILKAAKALAAASGGEMGLSQARAIVERSIIDSAWGIAA